MGYDLPLLSEVNSKGEIASSYKGAPTARQSSY